MTTTKNIKITITGILLILLSAAIFYFPNNVWLSHNEMEVFTIHYLLSGIFAVIVLIDTARKHRFRVYRWPKEYIFLFLTLLTISAFALNRDISVFHESELWLSVLIVAQCITFILYPFYQRLPRIINYIVYFIWGINLWVYFYFAIYLFPTYIVGVVGLLFFGLTIHLFVPAFSLLVILHELYRNRKYQSLIMATGIGFVLTAGVLGYSAARWNSVNQFFRKNFHSSLTDTHKHLLPLWVRTAQHMPNDYFFTQYLKLDNIYVSDFLSFGSFNFQDEKKHDPLVNVMSHIIPVKHISADDKFNILRTNEDFRHQSEDRLWSGKDLKTDHVINRIEVYPQFRISYTDLIMTIHNLSSYDFDQQEAIYSFYLPEGAVATSLSLWIEGEERKARLTTRHKADSAYTTIVSRQRDPSVVHWQEGNRLNVRVFPCTPKEARVFRIGITAPLKFTDGILQYQPIYFKGPSTAAATEHIEVLDKSGNETVILTSLNTSGKNFILDRNFSPGFTFSMEETPISDNPFIYKQDAYHIEPSRPSYSPVNFTTLLLDLNNKWTKSEIEEVLEFDYPVKVMTENSIIDISQINDETLNHYLDRNYSFIPFHKIEKPDEVLIITKGVTSGPYLNDIKNSKYVGEIIGTGKEKCFWMYGLNDYISPYLKTLVATHHISYDTGTIDDMINMLDSGVFYKHEDAPEKVDLPGAGISIVKSSAPLVQPDQMAPDHLLRMYNYQHLMENMQISYLFDKTPPEELYAMAEKAFAVTPFTSLIVLETQNDYDRFDIKKNKDTLGNAAFNNSGAVPEPHEWLLIIAVGLMVSIILFRRFI